MAEQRVGVGEVRDGKDLKFGSSGETIAGEEVDSSAGDETSGEARDWKDLKFGSSGDKRSGEARDEKDLKFGDGGETADADEDVQKQDSIEFDDFLKSFLGDDYDVSPYDGPKVPVYNRLPGFEPHSLGWNDDDSEPDTNRLDYFVVAPFDVAYGDDDSEPIGISSSNGSGEMVIQNFEQERGGGFEWWIGGGGLWEKLWLLLALWKIV